MAPKFDFPSFTGNLSICQFLYLGMVFHTLSRELYSFLRTTHLIFFSQFPDFLVKEFSQRPSHFARSTRTDISLFSYFGCQLPPLLVPILWLLTGRTPEGSCWFSISSKLQVFLVFFFFPDYFLPRPSLAPPSPQKLLFFEYFFSGELFNLQTLAPLSLFYLFLLNFLLSLISQSFPIQKVHHYSERLFTWFNLV